MQPIYKFIIPQNGDYKEYKVAQSSENTYEVIWFNGGIRQEYVVGKAYAENNFKTGFWKLTWSKEMEEEEKRLHFEIKNHYMSALHYFLQQIKKDDFFFDSTPSLDTLAVCLGQDAEFEKKIKRLIEEHLRDEEGYRDVIRGI